MTPTTEVLIADLEKHYPQWDDKPHIQQLLRLSAERLKELEAKYEAAREVAFDRSIGKGLVPAYATYDFIDKEIAARIKEKKL